MNLPPPDGRARRVLCVDDNRDAADSLALLCRVWGYQTSAAYDGPAALALYREHRPGVVLLDLGLPGMDGFEVARQIRGEFPGDRAYLVAVTGYGREEDRARCAEAGFDRHLLKPEDPPHFQALLAEAFGLVPT
jgi:CheY-like chemotaxis protein